MLDPRRNRSREPKGFWTRKTTLEKILLIALVVATIIVISLIVGIFFNKDNLCLTPACVQASALILKYIDQSVNPCDDFYKFTCGTYLKNAYRDASPTPFKVVNDKFENAMKEIVDEPIQDNDSHALKLMKQYFQACMDVDKIDEDNNKVFLKILDELGGWPMLKGLHWNSMAFNWSNFMAQATQIGIPNNAFFTLDKSNDGENIYMSLKKGQMLIHKDKLSTVVANVTKILGYAGNTSEVDEMVDFAIKLGHIQESNDVVDDNSTNSLTYGDLAVICPLPILDILNTIVPEYNLNASFYLFYDLGQYCKSLDNLLQETPKRVIANYMYWNVLTQVVNFLSSDVRNAYIIGYYGKNSVYSRFPACLSEANKRFKYVKETIYVRENTGKDVKKEIISMIDNIKSEFANLLKKNDWMDDETRSYALQKLANISLIIGGEDIFFDEDNFDVVLAVDNFNFTTDNALKMLEERQVKMNENFFSELYQPLTNETVTYWDEYFKHIVALNAYFLQETNTLILPSPILQDLFFNINAPKFMNYGSIGRIIGHEIMHGFEKSGRNITLDEEGKIYFDWWTPETAEVFDKKVECIIQQYENYTYKEQLNGTTTLDENASDFVGIDAAYEAYVHYVSKNGDEKRIPGLKYTPKQLYWIQANTFLCFKEVKFLTINSLEDADDEHALPSFRVNAGVKNSKYFAEDFRCPVGTPMNPSEKCQLM